MSDGVDLEARFELAATSYQRGIYPLAIGQLRELLTIDPQHARAHALLALSLTETRRIHAAEAEAKAAIQCAPEESLAHLAAGLVALAHRKLKEAARHLEEARALDPESDEPLRALGQLRIWEHRLDEARTFLEEARSRDPNSPATLVMLGELAFKVGRYSEASRYAREALENDPLSVDSQLLQGRVALAAGRTIEAKELALQALRFDPQHPGGHHLLAGVKSRESLLLGVWWRFVSAMGALRPGNQLLALLGPFLGYRLIVQALRDTGHPGAADLLSFVWLGWVAYTWVAPSLFRRMVEKELQTVQLQDF